MTKHLLRFNFIIITILFASFANKQSSDKLIDYIDALDQNA